MAFAQRLIHGVGFLVLAGLACGALAQQVITPYGAPITLDQATKMAAAAATEAEAEAK